MAIIKKELSAGILFFTETGDLLVCRMTELKRRDGNDRWDIPKGHVEEGESPAEAAIREAKEEAGIIAEIENLEDLGCHRYSDHKDIHLFMYTKPVEPSTIGSLKCTAFCTSDYGDYQIPEMDAYMFAHPTQWKHLMGPALLKTLAKIFN